MNFPENPNDVAKGMDGDREPNDPRNLQEDEFMIFENPGFNTSGEARIQHISPDQPKYAAYVKRSGKLWYNESYDLEQLLEDPNDLEEVSDGGPAPLNFEFASDVGLEFTLIKRGRMDEPLDI